MSIPIPYITEILKGLANSRMENLITQADARRILQEVREDEKNFPKFDPSLTEKSTYIAYIVKRH